MELDLFSFTENKSHANIINFLPFLKKSDYKSQVIINLISFKIFFECCIAEIESPVYKKTSKFHQLFKTKVF